MKFLLDTNFFLIPGKFKVDIFSELEKFGKPEIYTIDLVVKELERLTKGRGKVASYARIGAKLLRMKKVQILKSFGKNVDAELVRIARTGFVVCTQDRALIKKLKTAGIEVISLRQKKYLVKHSESI
jgi:rRNA-processing protein FCF1